MELGIFVLLSGVILILAAWAWRKFAARICAVRFRTKRAKTAGGAVLLSAAFLVSGTILFFLAGPISMRIKAGGMKLGWSLAGLMMVVTGGLAYWGACRMGTAQPFILRLGMAACKIFFGVVLPPLIYLLSTLVISDCKDYCERGWIDCLFGGNPMLLPLVLWATAALFTVETASPDEKPAGWIWAGCATGAVVSSVCLLQGIRMIHGDVAGYGLFILVPLYTAVWYWFRTALEFWNARLSRETLQKALLVNLPCWIGGLLWAQRIYRDLPQEHQGCFVVTAAGRGHAWVVGPHFEIERHGQRRQVNHQLVRFWELEHVWRKKSPFSHAIFRRVYNRVGPVMARRISSPLRADIVCLLLKPAEWGARWLVRRKS